MIQGEFRFRVVNEGPCLKVSGHLLDATNVELLFRDLIYQENQIFDLKDVPLCTWKGINSFYQVITQRSKNPVILHASRFVFLHLAVLDRSQRLLSFERPMSINWHGKSEEISGTISCGQWGKLPRWQDENLSEYIKKHWVGFASLEWLKVITPEASTLYEDLSFKKISYLEYLSFTLGTATGLVFSLEGELGALFDSLTSQVRAFIDGFRHYSDDESLALLESLATELNHLAQLSRNLILSLGEDAANLSLYADHFLALSARHILKGESLPYVLESTQDSMFGAIQKLTEKMEYTGYTLSLRRTIFKNLAKLSIFLENLAKIPFNQESLSQLREDFQIMDIASEDSVEKTLNAINLEIENLSTYSARFTVTVQGFDLARQILEHRTTELLTLKGWPISTMNDEGMSLLIDTAKNRRVTDQEMQAFSFFLNENRDAEPEQQRALCPSEVFIF